MSIFNVMKMNFFDEISYLSNYVSTTMTNKWAEVYYTTDRRWLEVIKYFKENAVPFTNCIKIVQYILTIPGANTPTERVFSVMNAVWTSDKTAMKIDTVSVILELKYNLGMCRMLGNFKQPSRAAEEDPQR